MVCVEGYVLFTIAYFQLLHYHVASAANVAPVGRHYRVGSVEGYVLFTLTYFSFYTIMWFV